jgi:hypothetical protein
MIEKAIADGVIKRTDVVLHGTFIIEAKDVAKHVAKATVAAMVGVRLTMQPTPLVAIIRPDGILIVRGTTGFIGMTYKLKPDTTVFIPRNQIVNIEMIKENAKRIIIAITVAEGPSYSKFKMTLKMFDKEAPISTGKIALGFR